MLKRNLTYLVFLGIFLAGQASASEDWELGFGLQAQAGLVYSGAWDPGWSASGAEVSFRKKLEGNWDSLALSTGLEYAGAGLGSQLTLPLGLVWSPAGKASAGLGWNLGLHFLPGLTLTRPSPLFLWGLEAGGEVRWVWESGWHAGLGAGVRLTSCPEYSSRVAEYTLWDAPVRLMLGWSPQP